jgi:dUTP pyrophosphatase
MKVKLINNSHHTAPSYETTGSAGMDLKAWLPEGPILLAPMERKLIPTGLHIELPIGFEAQVRPRSGLSIKQGLTCVNAVGTIDSDYRGEIRVPMINLSDETRTITDGDRIAQMIIAKYEVITWENTEQLSETERGTGGFGSTGV